MFTADDSIPIPTNPLEGATEFFKTLNIGQSFLIPTDSRNSIGQIAKKTGIKIKTKKEGEQVRVWRVS